MLRKILIIVMMLLIGGCSHWLDDAGLRDETIYPAALPIDNPPPVQRSGAIFQDGYEISLFKDRIPGRRGDILTVKLDESTKGQKKAKTKTNKQGDYSYTLPGVDMGRITDHPADFSSKTDFNGEGESNQENKLYGTISVTVTHVLSNGNLMIQGESWITINQGREYIRLTGIVRPYDIDSYNTISSQRVAHARITYSGNGQVANSATGGLFTQILLKFFPY